MVLEVPTGASPGGSEGSEDEEADKWGCGCACSVGNCTSKGREGLETGE